MFELSRKVFGGRKMNDIRVRIHFYGCPEIDGKLGNIISSNCDGTFTVEIPLCKGLLGKVNLPPWNVEPC